MGEPITTIRLFDGTQGAITKDGDLLSPIIDLRHRNLEASFSLHTIHAGGDITVTVQGCSTEGGTFMEFSTACTIVSDFAAGSGFWAISSFPVAPFIKLKFDENNTAAVTSLDAWLNYQ